VEEDNNWWF